MTGAYAIIYILSEILVHSRFIYTIFMGKPYHQDYKGEMIMYSSADTVNAFLCIMFTSTTHNMNV